MKRRIDRNSALVAAANAVACSFEALESRQLMSAAGTIDQTFGYHGYAGNAFGMSVNSIAVQADGKVVLVGEKDSLWAVARLNANGTADTTFGKNHTGVFTSGWGEEDYSQATSAAIQADGKIIVGGYHSLHEKEQLNISRLNVDGSFDKSFAGGTGAEHLLGFQEGTDGITDLAIQKDGRIVIASDHLTSGLFGDWDFMVGRLTSSGSWDSTFGDARSTGRAGYTTTGFGDNERDPVMTLQNDGKIILAGDSGSFSDGYHKQVLGRYTTAGQLDSTFDGDGKVVTEMYLSTGTTAVAVEPNGQILVVGSRKSTASSDHYYASVMKYNVNGSVAPYSVNTTVSSTQTSATASAVFIPAPGKYMLVGSVYSAGSSQTFAEQFFDSGARDTSFGTNGVSLFAGNSASMATMTGDGKIVAADTNLLTRFSAGNVTLTISSSASNAAEGGANGSVTFSRDQAYNFETRVYYQTGGTATPGQDFTGTFAPAAKKLSVKGKTQLIAPTGPAYITIPAGQTSVTVAVTIVNDSALEPAEALTVTALDDPNYVFAKRSIGVISLSSTVAHTAAMKTIAGGNTIFNQPASSATINIADNDSVHVNFQSASNISAGGYVADAGKVFADRGNGMSYGWDADNTANMRIRGLSGSPDFRYDSQALMQKNGANRKWEIAVPNGAYEVRIVAGDPSATDSTYKINAEGIRVVTGNPSGDTHWFRGTAIVTVTDGRLTITNGSGAQNNKIAFIDIKSAPLGAGVGAVTNNLPVKLYSTATAGDWTKRSDGLFSDKQIDDQSIWI